MTRLPTVSGKQLIAALGRLGFEVVRQKGSHVEQPRISDFHLTVLGPEVVLARYRLEAAALEPARRLSLRSSVWALRSGRWQILFHQGTTTTGL